MRIKAIFTTALPLVPMALILMIVLPVQAVETSRDATSRKDRGGMTVEEWQEKRHQEAEKRHRDFKKQVEDEAARRKQSNVIDYVSDYESSGKPEEAGGEFKYLYGVKINPRESNGLGVNLVYAGLDDKSFIAGVYNAFFDYAELDSCHYEHKNTDRCQIIYWNIQKNDFNNLVLVVIFSKQKNIEKPKRFVRTIIIPRIHATKRANLATNQWIAEQLFKELGILLNLVDAYNDIELYGDSRMDFIPEEIILNIDTELSDETPDVLDFY